MNCPHCNSMNDPSNQFCEKCGKPLHSTENAPGIIDSRVAKDYLFAHTFRLIISLLGLWIIYVVFGNLGFVKELSIPDVPIEISSIITLITLTIVFFLLIGYSRTLAALWPLAFPRAVDVGTLWNAIIYLVSLGIVYRILKPIIQLFSPDPELLMLFQLLLLIIAMIIVFRAGIILYHAIPFWYERIKEEWSTPKKINN